MGGEKGALAVQIEVSATIAGLEVLGQRVDEAVRQSVEDALHLFQAAGGREAPIGVEGNSTNDPGDLARSFDIEGPYGGDGTWAGRVGPTMIYARQRELGGPIVPEEDNSTNDPGDLRAPLLHFTVFGDEVFTPRVYQFPNPYTKRAYDLTLPALPEVVGAHVEAALA
jgi:hypothetical protein